MKPTDEQLECLQLFLTGESMVIEAGAGTGKTSTLRLLAAGTRRRGRYLAFNKAIVTDVQGSITNRVLASTAHSMAYQAVGKQYGRRLRSSQRIASHEIARQLGIRGFSIAYGSQRKHLADGFLGGHAMRAITNFCQSTDEQPGRQHIGYIDGIDVPDARGNRTYANNELVRDIIEPALSKAWADIVNRDGGLTFRHDHYLKMWQLQHPRIAADFILFDEAQDANPVMADIVAHQADHAQLVYVGDSNQAIYEFTGAVNTIATLETDHRRFLTQSFRFGPAIAAVANRELMLLGAELRIHGLPTIESTVGELDDNVIPNAILTRTNAGAVKLILEWMARGTAVHLVGGGDEVARFARAAHDLQTQGRTWHPELACFTSWGEVQEYVTEDAQGGELKLLVDLIDQFGVTEVLKALEAMPPESEATLLVSTAHKAKGREWPIVQIGPDFPTDGLEDPELRLRYVAVTRAREHLDATSLYPETGKRTDQPELPNNVIALPRASNA